MSQRTCAHCGGPLPDQDRGRPRKYCTRQCLRVATRNSSTKICTHPGCDRAVRAKGLCSTHYNQRHVPDRHPRVEVPCAVCGVTVTRARDSRRLPTCSVACRTLVQHSIPSDADHYDWARDAQRRALRLGATIADRVEREDVLQADGWRCYLCGVDTRIAASPFDPRSATVDHVIPISKGGQHVRENLRCCCLGCNSSKQALLLDELIA